MKDGVYHRDINLPAGLKTGFSGLFRVSYGNHARKAASEDVNGFIKLPAFITVLPANIVEIEVRDGAPCKAVVRTEYDDRCDLVLVINRDELRGSGMFARTVWLNRKDDHHRTLRREQYVH